MVKKPEYEKKQRIFYFKEFFDSTAFGLMPNQFINVLLFSILILNGAAWWIVGLANALKHIASQFSEIFIGKYDSKTMINRIRLFSVLYAFSFFIMIFGLILNNYVIFVFAMILSGISISSQGLLYRRLVKQELKFSYLQEYYKRINLFALFSVALTFVSAYLFIKINSLIIPLEIAAISFILSSYVLFKLRPEKKIKEISQFYNFKKQFKNIELFSKKSFFVTALALINAIIILTYSYLGIYIFENYKLFMLGYFGNIALVFGIAIVVSIILSKPINYLISNNYGQLPVIIFGIALFSLIPLSFSQSVDFISLILATSIGAIGVSLLRISSEIYMIKNNYKSKASGLYMSVLLLFGVLSMIGFTTYMDYFMILFFTSILALVMFFIMLVLEGQRR